jgi:hypothetical protein
MNEIWANRLIAGTKVWADMPASRRTAVTAILQQRVDNGTITQDDMDRIIAG